MSGPALLPVSDGITSSHCSCRVSGTWSVCTASLPAVTRAPSLPAASRPGAQLGSYFLTASRTGHASLQIEAAYDRIFSSQLTARLSGDLPVSANVRPHSLASAVLLGAGT